MLMKAAVGQDSSSSSPLIPPPSHPPLCPLVRWGCRQANLSSRDIKNPCEVSCCNFCLFTPASTTTLLIPLFLTCSSFDFLLFHTALTLLSLWLFTALFYHFSPVWTFYNSQQFAIYSVPLMSHVTAENSLVDLVT